MPIARIDGKKSGCLAVMLSPLETLAVGGGFRRNLIWCVGAPLLCTATTS